MPAKSELVYIKYANRLVSDLSELDVLLARIHKLLEQGYLGHEFSTLIERQKVLSSRIKVQHGFLDLIRTQGYFCPSEEDHLALENSLMLLSSDITEKISTCQKSLLKNKQALSALLSKPPTPSHGHKRALCQSHSAPFSLDISL